MLANAAASHTHEIDDRQLPITRTERQIKSLDDAMDEQIAALEQDRANPFTHNRIIQIWKWRRDVLAGNELSDYGLDAPIRS